MQISLKGEYKSLSDFTSDQLSDFTIITGENGSGKSQLIELIKGKELNEINSQYDYEFNLDSNIIKIQVEGLKVDQLSNISNHTWINTIENLFSEFKRYPLDITKLCLRLFEKGVHLEELDDESFTSLFTQQERKNILNELKKSIGLQALSHPNATLSYLKKKYNVLQRMPRVQSLNVLKIVVDFHKKSIDSITKVDFLRTPFTFELIGNPSLFNPDLEFSFLHYLRLRDSNSRSYFDKEKYGIDNNSISDEQFDDLYTPPWDKINEILAFHQLNFKFLDITRQDFSSEISDFYIKFINTKTTRSVNFRDLSSGEKLIIGLIIKIFASEVYNKDMRFPDLVVLDEPDAYLHPKMSKLLIDVLNETFVKKLGIKVIITTHSPSTIALAPEDSIYQLQNYPETSLKKIEKNAALKMLTGFIPTLSIDYENHKQVFVESPTDVNYYQTIFNGLNQANRYPFRLYFISNAMGNGNCSTVSKIVRDIRDSGNKTSFGIIDWDLDNNSSDFVKVHGENHRYSIENFIYDPIYMAVLFINNNGAHNIYTEIGLEKSFNQYLIGNQTNETLQKIVDWFFKKVYHHRSTNEKDKADLIEIYYYNDKKICIPKWYLYLRGHDLEGILRKSFSSLDSFKKEGELQGKLIEIMSKCFPFIPLASSNLIEEIVYWKD
jgi:predicted ATPase